jgi:endonuclease/exonuclease/phosphatase family metal-dependent hydrolase
MFQKRTGRRWTWKSPNGVTKTEIDYILTNRPDIITDVTVINQVNIGSDHRLVMSNIKLDVEVGSGATKSRCPTNRIKEDRIPA